MAKIETVTLKEMEVFENDKGEFETRFHNERKFPASITNYSLSMGEKLGLIESSQISNLADVQGVFEAAINPKADKEKALANLDVSKMLKVIYLAIIGVNRNLNLTYEDFTDLYHENTAKTIDTYTNLVLATLTDGVNEFSKGLQRSTKKK